MRIAFIRHGKTKGNLEKRYIGTTDESLCEEGIQELKENIHRRMYPAGKQIYSSPMKRCIQTAELIYPDCKIEVAEDFRECDFGRFEGKNYQELNGDAGYQAWIDSGGALEFSEGESPFNFRKRCEDEFLRVVMLIEQENGRGTDCCLSCGASENVSVNENNNVNVNENDNENENENENENMSTGLLIELSDKREYVNKYRKYNGRKNFYGIECYGKSGFTDKKEYDVEWRVSSVTGDFEDIETGKMEVFEDIKADRTGDIEAVFIVHGGTIMAVFSAFEESRKDYFDWHTENGRGFLCNWNSEIRQLKIVAEL